MARRETPLHPVGGKGPQSGQRGFTLLELVVGLTLLGLVLALLFGGVRFGTRAWEAGGAAAERAAEVRLVQSFLRRTLSRARPVARPDQGGLDDDLSQEPTFVGEPDLLGFTALMPAHLGVPGFYWIEFAAGDGRLVMRRRLYRPEGARETAASRPEEMPERVLIEGAARIEFAYFGPGAGGEPPRWRPRWADPLSLPRLIRVAVRFADGDGRTWPDLVVAPRIDPPLLLR